MSATEFPRALESETTAILIPSLSHTPPFLSLNPAIYRSRVSSLGTGHGAGIMC